MKKLLKNRLRTVQIIGVGIVIANLLSCNSSPDQKNITGIQPDRFKEITLPNLEIRKFVGLENKLAEVGGDSITLMNLKSKVILIEFTGVSCGPCKKALPFLKQLVIDNKDKDFEFISIETETRSINELLRHKKKNRMNYKYLVGGEDVLKKFKISGVPTFFILDENRIVRKYILGYMGGLTDKEIKESIDKLL